MTLDRTGPDGAVRVRLTVQPDGTTFLRCAGLDGTLRDAAAAVMTLHERIAAAGVALAAGRAGLDLAALAAGLVGVLAAAAGSASAWEAVVKSALVALAWAALTALRRPAFRVLGRLALRRAGLDGEA